MVEHTFNGIAEKHNLKEKNEKAHYFLTTSDLTTHSKNQIFGK